MKKMEKPELEFVKFSAEDVITTSGGPETVNEKYDYSQNVVVEGEDESKNYGNLSWNPQQ